MGEGDSEGEGIQEEATVAGLARGFLRTNRVWQELGVIVEKCDLGWQIKIKIKL